MDSKVKKDNLSDLVSDLTKPVESKPSSSDSKNPIVEPPKNMTDYQVVTPDGEVITLNKIPALTVVQKTIKGSNVEKILVSKDKKGKQYIVIVIKPTS